MIYHFVLAYPTQSDHSVLRETFEALAKGIEKALWQLGECQSNTELTIERCRAAIAKGRERN